MIFQTEKALSDLNDKISEDDKKKATDEIDALKKALEGTDIEEIKKKTEELNKTAMDLATKVYQEAAKAKEETGEATSTDTDGKEHVEDAEFEEKK